MEDLGRCPARQDSWQDGEGQAASVRAWHARNVRSRVWNCDTMYVPRSLSWRSLPLCPGNR
eukprot:15072201-Alexandrium_andersonii.AAC.1